MNHFVTKQNKKVSIINHFVTEQNDFVTKQNDFVSILPNQVFVIFFTLTVFFYEYKFNPFLGKMIV